MFVDTKFEAFSFLLGVLLAFEIFLNLPRLQFHGPNNKFFLMFG